MQLEQVKCNATSLFVIYVYLLLHRETNFAEVMREGEKTAVRSAPDGPDKILQETYSLSVVCLATYNAELGKV